MDELIVYIPWIFWPSPLWGNKELLFENDFFIYWAGGAGVKALIDDTRVFVVKPGPYEGPEMDKRDIIDNHFKLNNF